MSKVLAVCYNLLIFRLHFFGIRLYLFFHLDSPPTSLIFATRYLYAADACSLSLHSSSASKASSFRSSPMKTFHNSLPYYVPFTGWDSLSGAEITSTVCYIPCQSLLVLFRCINISCLLDAPVYLFHIADVLWGCLYQTGSFQPSFAQLLCPLTFCILWFNGKPCWLLHLIPWPLGNQKEQEGT